MFIPSTTHSGSPWRTSTNSMTRPAPSQTMVRAAPTIATACYGAFRGVLVPLSENWATLWEALTDAQPEHVAVVVGDAHLRWHELDETAARLAAAFAHHGVGHDTKIAQLMYNCPEYLQTVYGAFKQRAIPVNVNYRYLAPEIAHVLNDSDAEA